MSTSYIIRVGYNSTYSKEEVGRKLVSVIDDLTRYPDKIVAEVWRVDGRPHKETIRGYTESYRQPISDQTLKIVEDADGLPEVVQIASGGGTSRTLKEACRRAVCRLVLEAMHREGMEVSIVVA